MPIRYVQISSCSFLETFIITRSTDYTDFKGNTLLGARSRIAQYMLADIGYNNTKNFEGGFNLFQSMLMVERTHAAWKANPVTVN